MEQQTHPTFGNGKICYIELPATDIATSASFYKTVFGWSVREREDGSVSFDDGVGEVSGAWVTGRQPATATNGLMISIMVFDMLQTVEAVVANGGRIVQAPDMNARDKVALFSDPAGNVLSLYQHGR
jgi:predicted enzyme related to lactoylglutathione lyase